MSHYSIKIEKVDNGFVVSFENSNELKTEVYTNWINISSVVDSYLTQQETNEF